MTDEPEVRPAGASVHRLTPALNPKDPDNVLLNAIGKFQDVLILGYGPAGDIEVFSSEHFAEGGAVLWLLENFKLNLLSGVYGPEDE